MKSILGLLVFLCTVTLGFAQNYQDTYIKGIELMEKGEYIDAIAQFTETIERNDKFDKAYVKRGACYELLGDSKKALKDFTTAIGKNEKNAAAFYNRGLIRYNFADYKNAIADFGEAIKHNPTLAFAYYNRALAKIRLDDFTNACLDLSRAADMGIEIAGEMYRYTCK